MCAIYFLIVRSIRFQISKAINDGNDVEDLITYDYNEDGTIDKKEDSHSMKSYGYDDKGRLSGYQQFVGDYNIEEGGSAEITWEEGESASDPQNIQNNIVYQYYRRLFKYPSSLTVTNGYWLLPLIHHSTSQ